MSLDNRSIRKFNQLNTFPDLHSLKIATFLFLFTEILSRTNLDLDASERMDQTQDATIDLVVEFT